MPKATRARTNSPKAPAKRAASATADKSNGNASNGNAQPELESTIRNRAYELYLERGRQDGFDQEDWFRAEAEVVAQYQKRTA